MLKLAIFASTRGTDLDVVFENIKQGNLPNIQLGFVLSDKSDCGAMEKTKVRGFKTIFVDPQGKSRQEYDAECLQHCQSQGIDLILLIGYMRIISRVLIEPYKNKIINIHPSLLPKYPGMDLDVHRQVLQNKEKITGCTLHYVDERVDSGPIILQSEVEIDPGETAESLKKKVQAKEQETILQGLIQLSGNKK